MKLHEKDNYSLLIKNLPDAFAYYRVIADNNGSPQDFIFLDVNPAFEKMTGLTRDKVIGKKISEVYTIIAESDFDWVEAYNEISRTGEAACFEQYFNISGRSFAITAYIAKPGYFSAIFHDTTGSHKIERDLISTAYLTEEFLSASTDEINYQRVTDHILAIAGAKYAAFNLYDDSGKTFTTVALSGISEHIRKASNLLGFQLVGNNWAHDRVRAEKMRGQVITRFSTLSSLTATTLSPQISSLLEKTFQIGEILVVKILGEEKMIGDFTIIMGAGKQFQNEIIVEIFTRQVGLALSRKKSEEALRDSEQKYRTLLDNLPVGVYRVTPGKKGRFLMANPAFLKMLGFNSEGELKKINMCDIYFNPKDRKEVSDKAIKNEGAASSELKLRKKDGTVIWCSDTARLIRNENGNPYYFDCIIEDITERKLAEEKIRYLSFHDSLTGLYNRRYLEEEMQRLDTKRQLPISIIMADLNDLKLVNDAHGHGTGDDMLKYAAKILKEACRKEDIVARWGGDEFVIFLPQTTEKEAKILCKRIGEKCRKVSVHKIPISIALGAAGKNDAAEDLEKTLRVAEDNMYKQKFAASRGTKITVFDTLQKTLEEKSFENEAHTRRMQETAQRIGEKKGLSNTELNYLSQLITLHDIGKINIPEKILRKKGALTLEEWKIMKKHPEVGYRITRTTEEFAHVAEDILAHHEHWDGSGYPQGLRGKEIPLLARIASIADAYEVMSSGRPYKKPMQQREIIAELKKNAGTQFDPELIEIFLLILEEKIQS